MTDVIEIDDDLADLAQLRNANYSSLLNKSKDKMFKDDYEKINNKIKTGITKEELDKDIKMAVLRYTAPKAGGTVRPSVRKRRKKKLMPPPYFFQRYR